MSRPTWRCRRRGRPWVAGGSGVRHQTATRCPGVHLERSPRCGASRRAGDHATGSGSSTASTVLDSGWRAARHGRRPPPRRTWAAGASRGVLLHPVADRGEALASPSARSCPALLSWSVGRAARRAVLGPGRAVPVAVLGRVLGVGEPAGARGLRHVRARGPQPDSGRSHLKTPVSARGDQVVRAVGAGGLDVEAGAAVGQRHDATHSARRRRSAARRSAGRPAGRGGCRPSGRRRSSRASSTRRPGDRRTARSAGRR